MLEGEALIARFHEALTKTSAEVIEIETLEALPRALGDVLSGLAVSLADVAIAPDPVFAGLAGARVVDASGAQASLTHAWAGIAETGTLLLASGVENPTSLVFLPDVHIVAVSRDRIYACYEDALSGLLSEQGALSRAVNLVTGPSRTGDIGGRIVLGAHGPRHLIAIVYGRKNAREL